MNTKLTSESKTQSFCKATLIKLAVDAHARSYSVVRQVDNSRIQPAQRFEPGNFVPWAAKQKELAQRVVVCYESGPFGFVLARQLLAVGVECVVMAAQQLDGRKRRVQTDELDALEIASRLDRYLAGNSRALTTVKIPTVEQELKRCEARQRGQLLKSRKQLEAQGRSLLVLNGYVNAQSSWWQERVWSAAHELWPVPVVEMLGRWREVLLKIEDQLQSLTRKLEASLPEHLPQSMPQLPIGVGALTWVILSREVLDWNRFKNRRQVGSFSGLVASESSSGQSRRQGHITKVGNPRIRALEVELVWRLIQFQPEYWLVKKWRSSLRKGSPSVRKKAAVAMARQCGVDLWRLATGATTPQKLGLRLASSNP
jgi:transposase